MLAGVKAWSSLIPLRKYVGAWILAGTLRRSWGSKQALRYLHRLMSLSLWPSAVFSKSILWKLARHILSVDKALASGSLYGDYLVATQGRWRMIQIVIGTTHCWPELRCNLQKVFSVSWSVSYARNLTLSNTEFSTCRKPSWLLTFSLVLLRTRWSLVNGCTGGVLGMSPFRSRGDLKKKTDMQWMQLQLKNSGLKWEIILPSRLVEWRQANKTS